MYFYLTMPYPKTKHLFNRIGEIYSDIYNICANIKHIEEKNKEYDRRLLEIEEGIVSIRNDIDISKINRESTGIFNIKFF